MFILLKKIEQKQKKTVKEYNKFSIKFAFIFFIQRKWLSCLDSRLNIMTNALDTNNNDN